MIVPHLAITISRILKGIKAEGTLVVQTINRIYHKVSENPESTKHQILGIQSVYEIVDEFSRTNDVMEEMKQLDYLWKHNFTACAEAVMASMDKKDTSQESKNVKTIFIYLCKLLIKMFKILEEDVQFDLLKYIKQLMEQFFTKTVENLAFVDDETKEEDIKVIHTMQKLQTYGSDFIALDKKDLGLFLEIADFYYKLAFDYKIFETLTKSFLSLSEHHSLEEDNFNLASIISQGIHFHKNIFDNPNLWIDDILYNEEDLASVHKTEEKLKTYYDNDRLKHMCESVISSYLKFGDNELEMFHTDPIEFYFLSKDSHAHSVLRDEAIGFINSIKMRFPSFLTDYAKEIKQMIFGKYNESAQGNFQSQVEKEALFSFLQQSIDIEDDMGEDGLLQLLEHELMANYEHDAILKMRVIQIFASISYQLSKMEDKKYIVAIVEQIVQMYSKIDDFCLKLCWVFFIHQFYDNYYLEKDMYSTYIPSILSTTCELIFFLRKNMHHQALFEILEMFNVITQKYPEIALEFIEKVCLTQDTITYEEKCNLIPILNQLLAVIEDERISVDLAMFTSKIIVDFYNPPGKWDLTNSENALKWVLIYLRRLQNFDPDIENPFKITLPFFQLILNLADSLECGDDDERTNTFMILEEMHFCLSHATAEITESHVIEIYLKVFTLCYDLACTHENPYLLSLTCNYAATLMVSNNFSKEIWDIAWKLRDKVKEDLVERLIKKAEEPSKHDRWYVEGYLLVFWAIFLSDFSLNYVENVGKNQTEMEFIQLLSQMAQEYLGRGLFETEEEEYEEYEGEGEQFAPIWYSVVYLWYSNMLKTQGIDPLEVLNKDVKEKWEWYIKTAVEKKENIWVVNDGLYIWDSSLKKTKDCDVGLLVDIPNKKKLISKQKTNIMLKTFIPELNLFKQLIDD
jgi:hypothetical protein